VAGASSIAAWRLRAKLSDDAGTGRPVQ
jgi:hypothetical protein